MILLSNSIANKKNEKKQKPTPTKKNETGEKKNLFNTVSPILGPVHLVLPRKKTLLNCVTYTWPHLLLKKICLLCHLYLAPFICFSTCCRTLDTLPCCVTYTWHSKPHSATEEDASQLCHLYLALTASTLSCKLCTYA